MGAESIAERRRGAFPPPNRLLVPVEEFTRRHPGFTLAQLRAWIFGADANGFDVCVRRIGRRVYIDEAQFFIWVDQVSELSKPAPGERFGKLPNRVGGAR